MIEIYFAVFTIGPITNVNKNVTVLYETNIDNPINVLKEDTIYVSMKIH